MSITACGNMGVGKSVFFGLMTEHYLKRRRIRLKENPNYRMSIFTMDFSNNLNKHVFNGLQDEDAPFVDVFDPTLPDYVPKYNLTHLGEGEDIDRKTDSRTRHLQSLFSSTEWSSGIGQIIYSGLYLCFSDPKATLLDMRKFLDNSPIARERRAYILKKYVKNEEQLRFWSNDYDRIKEDTKLRALRKITTFLGPKRAQLICGVKENCFEASRIMHEGHICPSNLDEGILGVGLSKFFASCMQDDIADATKSRSIYSDKELALMPAHIIYDEFFKGAMKEFEANIVSFRKFNVSLVLSYHFKEQLSPELYKALKACSTHIFFKQGFLEAKQSHAELLGEITPKQIMKLKQREGFIINPDSEIIPFKTITQKKHNNEEVIQKVMERNLRDNYIKISELEKSQTAEKVEIQTISRSGDEI